MKQNWHIKAVAGLAVAAAVAGGAYWSGGKFGSAMGCTDALLHTLPSPDGHNVAYVFRRTCGPTIPDSVQANLQPATGAFDGMKYRPFVAFGNASDMEVRWDTPDQLTVIAPPTGKVAFRHPQVASVKINYQ